MPTETTRLGRRHVLHVDPQEVSARALRAAAYRFGDRFSLDLGGEGLAPDRVALVFAPSASDEEIAAAVRDFFRELNDQVLREMVREETREIRAVILAHTFSRIARET